MHLGGLPLTQPATASVPSDGLARRRLLSNIAVSAGLSAVLPAYSAIAQGVSDWAAFKQRFVLPEGRVVDTGNNGVSHSEGQSYGMLFAVANNDRPTFDLLKTWTAHVLRRPTDALHAWRYLPDSQNAVPDKNNASDGDLLIALALSRAAALWGRPEDAAAALAIARDIRRYLIVNAAQRLVLLPARDGFVEKSGPIVNLSYYNFVAFAELGRLDPSPLWTLLAADGKSLIADARFGRWQLPPDWLTVGSTGAVSISSRYPPLCSFDAIRVPLNLVWSRSLTPMVSTAFGGFWTTGAAYQPAWANLMTDQVSPYPAPSGLVAVRDITLATPGQAPALPSVAAAPDYYSASLIMLSQLAWAESAAGASGGQETSP
jgi:endo-1,4-beta-D-glucanase Y